MKKMWLAVLSAIGLTGSFGSIEGQVLKGSETTKDAQTAKNTNQTKASSSARKKKLTLHQETLHQLNQGSTLRPPNGPTNMYPCSAPCGGNVAMAKAPTPEKNKTGTKAKTKKNAALTKAGTGKTKANANTELTKAK